MSMERCRFVLLASAALALGGCVQLDTVIRLHEDGSATVTERLGFSRRLLDMAKDEKRSSALERFLTKEAAVERERSGQHEVTTMKRRDLLKSAALAVAVAPAFGAGSG